MSQPAHALSTYQDLLAVPEHLTAELIDGDLIATPRPAVRHTNACSSLGYEIGIAFHRGRGGPGGWWILFEPELHLAGDVLVPDLAGWRRERMPVLPDTTAIDLTPDWVCEVVSPLTGCLDRVRKMPVYAANDVRHIWLVDPNLRTLEVFRLEGSGWLLVAAHGDDAVVRAEPFEAVEIDLLDLWGETRTVPRR